MSILRLDLAERARARAMSRLVADRQEHYARLLNEERQRLGLPPVRRKQP